MVFKIGTQNYADRIIAGTYKINSKDISQNWTDASGKSHRRLKRTKVSGTVDMFFRNMEDFNAFIANLAAIKSATLSYEMQVTVNNLNENKTIDAFLDFDPIRAIDGMNKDYMLKYSIKIEER